MRGKEVPNPCSSIRLFALCAGMKWSHLPVSGGLYDQHPDLLDQFRYIFAEQSKHEEREHKKNERESRNRTGRAGRVS